MSRTFEDPVMYVTLVAAIIIGILLFTAIQQLVRNARRVKGAIIGKSFEPSHVESDVTNALVGDSIQAIPTTRTVPDIWLVTIRPTDGSSDVTREVPEAHWNALSIGDHWSE